MSYRVLVVGQSNMAAAAAAARSMAEKGTMPPILSMAFMQLLEPQYRPYFVGSNPNPRLVQDLDAKLKDADVVLSCLGGNAHSVFGLVNHKAPYDFVLDSEPTRPLTPGRELVPCEIVRSALTAFMQTSNNFSLLDMVRSRTTAPMFHSESPPPIPSEEHIRKFARKFEDRIAQFGVAPGNVRWKLWRIQSEAYAAYCSKIGVTFMPVPQQTLDDQGMLAKAAWGTDPTHGNEWFGTQVILQLADKLQSPAGASR
jgi:hypothetical protein